MASTRVSGAAGVLFSMPPDYPRWACESSMFLPFIVGIWDDESSPTPIVLYKHCEAWTAEDAARIVAHVRVQTAEQQAEVRALRGNSPDHPNSWVGGARLRSGHGAS